MEAKYTLCIGTDAQFVYNALEAELKARAPDKGDIRINLEDDCLIIEIKSNTISGLRALSNSFLLLVYSAYSSLKETS